MRTSDVVYERLRDDILTWRIPAGTALSEVELAERLGVSRTPLRSALARLTLEGLVDSSRGRTGVVPDVSADSVRELFELREALEVHAARLAAKRGEAAVFGRLAAEFDDAARILGRGAMDGYADEFTDEYYEVIGRFDSAVDDAIANRPLRTALDGSRVHLARARRLAADNPERLLRAAGEHAAICRALAAGDAELAASATLVHLRASLATILTTLASRAADEGTA
jgi:DNA-binding GntR family transcriptional regulator